MPASEDRRGRARDRPRRHALRDAQLARGGVRQPLGLADHALPLPARRPDRIARRGRRREHARHEQVRAEASESAAAARVLERAALPAGVPARVLRDELPAAALPEGRARQARRLLHARLQPAVDEPRRLLVDGGAAGQGEDRPARRADADVERDGVVRRLHPADGPRHRAPRHDEPGDARRAVARIPAAGAARRAREARRADHGHPRGEPRRGVGRERVLGRAQLEDRSRRRRSASASSSSRPYRPGQPITMDEYYGWMFENSVPGPAGSGREGAAHAARIHAEVRRVQGLGQVLQPRARARAGSSELEGTTRSKTAKRSCATAPPSASSSTALPCAGFNTPSRRLEFYSPTLADWGWPEHALPRYVPGPRALARPEARRGRVRSAAELPAADADPHALAGEVALRDLAQQPAVDLDGGRAAAQDRRPATS